MRRLTAALIVILLLGAGLAVSAHILIDRSNLKEEVITAVKRQTGRDLTMARFSVGILPWPYFSARNVVLHGRYGMQGEPTLRARDIRASIALMPLLWREIRLENLTIGHGSVFLHRDDEGIASWEFDPQPSMPASSSRSPARPTAHWALKVGSAKLDAMQFDLYDTYAHRSGTVMIDHAEFDGLSAAAPYLDIHGRRGNTPFRVNGHVGPLTLFQGQNPPWAISLGATLGNDGKQQDWMNIDGQITDTRHLRGFSGVVRGEMASLADLDVLFPNANLPALEGVGGEIGIYDADPRSAEPERSLQEESLQHILTRLGVNHLHLHVNDAPAWHGMTLGAIHADADTLSSALTLSATMQSSSIALAMQGQFGTLAQAGTAWQSGFVTPLPVSVDLRDAARLSGAGLTAHLAGEIGAKSSSLSLEGQAQTVSVLQAALHDVTLKGHVERDASGTVQISGMTFASHEAAGSVEAKAAAPLLSSVDGRLHFDRLDLDALSGLWRGPVSAPKAEAGAAAPTAGVASPIAALTHTSAPQTDKNASAASSSSTDRKSEVTQPSYLSNDLHRFVRNGHGAIDLSADTLRFNGADYRQVSGHIGVDAGKVTIESIKGEGNGLTLAGHGLYDSTLDPALVKVTFSPLLVPATLAQNLLSIPDLFRGPVMLVGQIEARGDTRAALRESLAGTLGLSMVGGSIDATRLGPYLGDAARAVLSHHDLNVRCLGLHARFANGQADLDTIGMEAGALSLSGHGRYGLAQGALDLHLLPRIGFGGTGASTPVLVTGTVDSPQAHQEASAGRRFEVTIGGSAPDTCPDILAASREGIPGEAAAAPKKHSQASELLHGLGILH